MFAIYPTAEFKNNREAFYSYYDDIEVYSDTENVHFKAALQKRNRYMADRSDLILCYVEHKSGGAYQTMRYANGLGKDTVNLANSDVWYIK